MVTQFCSFLNFLGENHGRVEKNQNNKKTTKKTSNLRRSCARIGKGLGIAFLDPK